MSEMHDQNFNGQEQYNQKPRVARTLREIRGFGERSKERQQNKDQNKAKELVGEKERVPEQLNIIRLSCFFRMGAEQEKATLPIFSMRRTIIICQHTGLE